MPATAPDSGYAPTSVDLVVQSSDATDTDGEIARLTIPYGGRAYTDQLVADVIAAMSTAVLLPFPGGRIVQTEYTYSGQATVTVQGDPPTTPTEDQ